MFIFISWCHFQSPITSVDFTEQTMMMVEPDEINVNDNFVSGVGKVGKQRVLFCGKLTTGQVKVVQSGNKLKFSQMNGEISNLTPATNYGEYDFSQYYRSLKIRQQIKFTTCQVEISPVTFSEIIHQVRFKLKNYFAKMPRLLSFFGSELLLADNPAKQNQAIIDNYKDLGIIHLLSISGLHVSIYILFLSTCLYLLKVPEKTTFCACGFLLIFSILLSSSQAGFVRASLSFILGKWLNFRRLKLNGYDLLALVTLIHLFFCPQLFMGTGAVLSYLLALGLQMTEKMSEFKQSLALNLLLTPLLLFYFYQTNLLTLVFNLLAIPYFNFVVMPLSLGNLLLFPIWPNLSTCLEKILEFFEAIIALFSKSQLGILVFGKINWWQCLSMLILTTILILTGQEKRRHKRLQQTTCRWLFLLYLFSFISIHFPLSGQVTFIDVGQGDSILITTPFNRKAFLIDTGGKLNFSGKKITPQVKQKTIPFLKALGITHLDGIFVSHQDADHVGDIQPLLDAIPVKRLYMAKGLLKNPSFRKRITNHVNHTQLVELLAGDLVRDGSLTFQVVHPFKPGLGKNEDSLAITFVAGKKRWLFTGDLDQAGEEAIEKHYDLKVDYFKLGHHGSKTASNPNFLQKIAPELVFISAGRHNRFNHPHPETLATLKKLQIPYVSTQDCGMISWYYGFLKPHFEHFVTEKIE